MVIVILEIKANPGTGSELATNLNKSFPETRAFDGNIDIIALQNQEDPDTIVLYERWETRENYEKYLAWRTETGMIANLMEAIQGEPSIRYFDVTEA